jgi:shikimate kinase
VGKLLAEKLMREYKDTDHMIEESLGKTVPQVFADSGEAYFREQESISVTEASASVGTVISTGGGAVLREENRRALLMNGRIYFLDRPLHMLIPTSDRPLSSNTADIKKRYNERYDIYSSFCNKKIDNSGTVSEAVEAIATDFAKTPRK